MLPETDGSLKTTEKQAGASKKKVTNASVGKIKGSGGGQMCTPHAKNVRIEVHKERAHDLLICALNSSPQIMGSFYDLKPWGETRYEST